MKPLLNFFNVLAVTALLGVTAQAAPTSPDVLVKQTVEQVLSTLRAKKEEFKQQPGKLYQLVDTEVLPHFDFDRMSRLVLAKNWKTATSAQQQEFVKEFRTLIVRTYALSLLNYTDETISYLPMKGDPASRKVTIRTEITKPGSTQKLPIEYKMYLPKNKWQVYDVTVDNISLILNYRQSYADEVHRNGLNKLIADMAKKNAAAETVNQ